MRFYQATSFLFPRHYMLRLFAVCFVGTHIPLLTFIGLQLADGHTQWNATIALVAATLLGTGATLIALAGLLKPLRVATDALVEYQENQTVPDLPYGGRDTVGRLLSGIQAVTRSATWLIEELDEVANRDPLTTLWNRRGFHAGGEAMLGTGRTMAVALIDLDWFKTINDRFGHEQGDDVLRAVANALHGGVRRQDIVARWGGEEFAVLFVNEAVEEAATVLRRIQQTVAALDLPDRSERLTFSGGVSTVRVGERALGPALARADAALYRAKDLGRDRVEVVAD